MSAQPASSASSGIPLSTVRRWALKAAALGFCAGLVAAIAALQAS